jgi:predicted Zn-dependent protease
MMESARLSIIVCSVGFMAFFSVGCESSTDPLQEARRLWLQGDHEAARPIYENHLTQNPQDYQLRFDYGQRLAKIDEAEAIRQFSQIPDDNALAFEAARQVFAIATRMGDDQLAEEALRRMERLQPDDAAVLLSLAEHYFRTMQYQDAEAYARRTLEEDSDRAETWLLLAEVLDELGRTAEAEQPLAEAYQRNSDSYAIRANYAYVLQFAGKLDEAEEHVSWCLNRKPDDPAMLGIKATIERANGAFEQALETIRQATDADPNHLANRLLQADLLIYQRQGEAAFEILKPLLSQHPNHRPLLASLARAAAISGRRDEAVQFQKRIAELIRVATERESGNAELQAPDATDGVTDP